MRTLVRYTINGVEITGIIMGQERDPRDGRWIYDIHQTHPATAHGLTARLHFSEFEIIRAPK